MAASPAANAHITHIVSRAHGTAAQAAAAGMRACGDIGAGGGRKGLEAMIAAAAAQAQEAEAPAPPLTVDASAALNISDDKTAIAESAYRRFLLPSFSVAMVTPFDAWRRLGRTIACSLEWGRAI